MSCSSASTVMDAAAHWGSGWGSLGVFDGRWCERRDCLRASTWRGEITEVSATAHDPNTYFNVLGETEVVVEQARSGAEVREGHHHARDMALNAAPDDLLDHFLPSL